MDDLSGSVVDGRYRLDERIAQGAMGVVYRATSLRIERAVAIKLMHASLPAAMAARARFEREAKLMAIVEHPHCVAVIDYGVHEHKPYVVMELVRGRSLHDLLAEQKRFEIARAADVMRQILSGLAHAHDQGIIHRDIKPANIMVTPKAPLGVHVRILDFGLARMLEASNSLTDGFAVGTPSYMAPEQCRGETVDARADLYSCGVVLFEMIAGRKPFVAKDPIEIIKKVMNEPTPQLSELAPECNAALDAVVARALAKSPDQRFTTAIAMSDAIDAALSNRAAAESTAVLPENAGQSGPSAVAPIDPSVDVPITVGSSVVADKPPKKPALRPTLPVSRVRWVVLAALVAIAGGAYAIVALTSRGSREPERAAAARDAAVESKPAPPVIDPIVEARAQADALVVAGRSDAALDALAKARKQYPDSAALAFDAGKLYFGKLWWTDGIKSFRDAIRLDAAYRTDPALIDIVVRGFATTPEYDDRLGGFLAELGSATEPALDELARNHANPRVRARAAAQLRRTRASTRPM